MGDNPTAAADYVKFAAALVGLVESDLTAIGSVREVQSAIGIEAALSRLAAIQSALGAVIEALDGGDAGHYGDGRPIASHVRFGDDDGYVYAWHPDPASPANEPHEIGTVTTRNGTRKRIVVSAPGQLDSITVSATSETVR